MKLIKENNYFKITTNDGDTFKIDIDKIDLLLNNGRLLKISKSIDSDYYHYRGNNNKTIYIISILTGLPFDTYDWSFKNNDSNDYQLINIKYKLRLTDNLPKSFKILAEYPGHVVNFGKSAGKTQNTYWLVNDKTIQSNPFYIMNCGNNIFTIFSEESLDKIIKPDDNNIIPTWYKLTNGYIGAHINKSVLYMHQIIMNYYRHGNNTQSIDHINQDKLDNRISNLRIATQTEQNLNRTLTHSSLKGIKSNYKIELPKYIVYYKNPDIVDESHDFFRIEGHPKEKTRWTGSKSKFLSIDKKLKQAVNKLDELNNMQ